MRPDQLLGLPLARAVHRGDAVTFTPFLGNLIFAERFRAVAPSTTAFGVNLLGAILEERSNTAASCSASDGSC